MQRGARLALAAVLLAAVTACSGNGQAPIRVAAPERPAAPVVAGPPTALPGDPNIVLILMDDFSLDLLQTMRNAGVMAAQGASYRQAYVVDSLCCVSRTSLLTGQYPHQTGVLTNTANTPNPYGPIGGWEAFAAYGNQERSVNVRLQEAGYTTGFVGKFLNQYEYHGGEMPPVPPGWSDWQVLFGSAYDGWGFESTYLDGDGQVHVREHPTPPGDASDRQKDAAYAGNVTSAMALRFIREHQLDEAPYFLEIAPFAPHNRVQPEGAYPGDPMFAPAFRDRTRPGHPGGNCSPVRCGRLTVDDLPGFGDDPADNAPYWPGGEVAPAWRTGDVTLSAGEAVASLRNRARMVQSIDRMLGRVLASVDDNTYVVLTSDNGFHLGQHGLGRGKGTPYDSDVHVPLLVVGPGVATGPRDEVVTNLDLSSTFEDLAGLRPAAFRSGLSLVPTFGDRLLSRRDHVVFEHTYAPSLGMDPDRSYAGGTMDLIPSYVAVRSRTSLLVRLDLDPSWAGTSYAWEFYDYRSTRWERTNEYAAPRHAAEIAQLRQVIERFDRCSNAVRDEAVPRGCRDLDPR